MFGLFETAPSAVRKAALILLFLRGGPLSRGIYSPCKIHIHFFLSLFFFFPVTPKVSRLVPARQSYHSEMATSSYCFAEKGLPSPLREFYKLNTNDLKSVQMTSNWKPPYCVF